MLEPMNLNTHEHPFQNLDPTARIGESIARLSNWYISDRTGRTNMGVTYLFHIKSSSSKVIVVGLVVVVVVVVVLVVLW